MTISTDALQSTTDSRDTTVATASSPSTDTTESLDPNVKMLLEIQLNKNLQYIQDRYALFVASLCESVENNGVTYKKLCTYLINMFPFCTDNALAIKLQEADSVDKIFNLVSTQGASFFHYDIFESIRKRYCNTPIDIQNPDLKYFEDFQEYIDRHRISEFFKINPKLRTEYSGDLEELAFKFNIPDTEKVGKLVNLRYEFIRIFGFEYSAVQLVGVEEGCVIVTFLIPRAMVETVCTPSSEQIEELRSLSVLWLKCGDKEVNLSGEANAEGKILVQAILFTHQGCR